MRHHFGSFNAWRFSLAAKSGGAAESNEFPFSTGGPPPEFGEGYGLGFIGGRPLDAYGGVKEL